MDLVVGIVQMFPDILKDITLNVEHLPCLYDLANIKANQIWGPCIEQMLNR